jgi:hypothetical protein
MHRSTPRFARPMATLATALLMPLVLQFSPMDGNSLPAPIAAQVTTGAPQSQPA